MLTHTYLVTSPRFGGEVEFRFGATAPHWLVFFESRAGLTVGQTEWLAYNMPRRLDAFRAWVEESASLTARQVHPDLGFGTFWDAYAHKVGNKARCMTLWYALTDNDRLLVLDSLPAYARYLSLNTWLVKVWPERYLSQRRFDTDYGQLSKKP